MRQMKKFMKAIMAFGLALCMMVALMPTLTVKAADETQISLRVVSATDSVVGGGLLYKMSGDDEFTSYLDVLTDGGGTRWLRNITVGSKICFKVTEDDGYVMERGTIGARGNGQQFSNDVLNALKSEAGYEYTVTDTTELEIEIYFSKEGDNPGPGDDPNPPSNKKEGQVYIGETKIFDSEAEQQITVPDGAEYTVYIDERDNVVIEPLKEVFKDNFRDGDVSKMKGLTLDYINISGNIDLVIKAGLNYTPEGMTDGHIELVVPLYIQCGYASYAINSPEGTVTIDGGNFNSTVNVYGNIYSHGFTISDVAKMDIKGGFVPDYMASSTVKGSYVEFNGVELNASPCPEDSYSFEFYFYEQIRVWDDAKLNINTPRFAFETDSVEVATGGSINFNGSEDIVEDMLPKLRSGYYVQLGEILQLGDTGRFQDNMKYVDCVEGDFSDAEGRYIYKKTDKSFELKSTTSTMWSLGYSFKPGSGDQYVEHGHFEIYAGSGITNGVDENGGEYWFEAGTEVTFKLVPDTGYKYKTNSFKFNDSTSSSYVKAMDEPGVYVMTMPKNPVHVSCQFVSADDEIETDGSKMVDGADVNIPAGDIDGIGEFVVKDTTLSSGDEKAFAETASDGKEIGAALDLSLNEVVDKIGTNDQWSTKITDLEKPMDVTLVLDESLAGNSEYEVIRQHNGKTEVLKTTYDEKTNSVTFSTDGYSKYAIAYKKAVPAKKGTVLKDTKTKGKYKVSSSSAKNPTVIYTGSTSTKLTKITVPATVRIKGVTYKVVGIAGNALKGCKKLTSITLGKNVTSISKNAFKGASKLKTIKISSSKLTNKTVAKGAFAGVKKGTVKVPKAKVKAYKKLFKSKGLSSKVKVSK